MAGGKEAPAGKCEAGATQGVTLLSTHGQEGRCGKATAHSQHHSAGPADPGVGADHAQGAASFSQALGGSGLTPAAGWQGPTLQCVVLTGSPTLEAITTVNAEASSMVKPLREGAQETHHRRSLYPPH